MLPESPPRACFWGWSGVWDKNSHGGRRTAPGRFFLLAWTNFPPNPTRISLRALGTRPRSSSLVQFLGLPFVLAACLCASLLAIGTTLSIAPVSIASCVVCSNFRSIRNGSAGLVSLAATASTFAYLSAERLIPTLGNHRSFASACAASIDFPLLAPSSTVA
ncbi:hypothetical protein M431DRAFT_478664 [Trichoderma harzianum CBS 226.95]|uniref:Uncharacterized protein n=1 Tax=Trichoderma harzianum CBS 226.95 TaxID=983964 RepID=A0A2T4ARC3_TRIHA|nr:hypothetical protein M431DRAFT_478664 [Trichoderma harzianum CBS 226.95]PTB59612.1 hypothetical protein M431DRAFT_478664 [Trichoderma harzianum CBS 226.95]